MVWYRGGYYGVWYAAFAALFARWVGSHDYPLMLALGCFVLAPMVILGLCIFVDYQAFVGRRASVEAAVRAGRASRPTAVATGILGAGVALAATAAVGGFAQIVGFWAIMLLPAATLVGWYVGFSVLETWIGPSPDGKDAEPERRKFDKGESSG